MDGFELTPRCAPAFLKSSRHLTAHTRVCVLSITACVAVANRAVVADREALGSALGRVLAAIPTQARPAPSVRVCLRPCAHGADIPLCVYQGRSPFTPVESAVLEQALVLSPEDLATLLGGAADAFRAAAASGTNAQVRAVLLLHHGSSCLTALPPKQGLAERVTAAGGNEDAVRVCLLLRIAWLQLSDSLLARRPASETRGGRALLLRSTPSAPPTGAPQTRCVPSTGGCPCR